VFLKYISAGMLGEPVSVRTVTNDWSGCVLPTAKEIAAFLEMWKSGGLVPEPSKDIAEAWGSGNAIAWE
jgi:hypothetical protein